MPVEIEGEERKRLLETEEYQERMEESPFLYLTCDLPQPPLFKDEKKENIIPQVKMIFSSLIDLLTTNCFFYMFLIYI